MKIPGRDDSQATGIGLFLHDSSLAEQAPTPFHADAAALLLATKVARSLQLQQVTFLTDNLSLARASATNSISAQQVPWELRDVMASLQI
jgi:hypothetical protein